MGDADDLPPSYDEAMFSQRRHEQPRSIQRQLHSLIPEIETIPSPSTSEATEDTPFLIKQSHKKERRSQPALTPTPSAPPQNDGYVKRPITAGPVVYEGNLWLRLSLAAYLLLEIGTKIVVCVVYIGTASRFTRHDDMFTILPVGTLCNCLNMWPLFLVNRMKYLTIRYRYTWFSKGKLCSSIGFLLLLVDCFCFILLGFGSLYNTKKRVHLIIIIPYAVLLICTIVVFHILKRMEFVSYDPAFSNARYSFKDRAESSNFEVPMLSVKESGPFRIVIQNIGRCSYNVGYKFTVIRYVHTLVGRHNPKNRVHKSDIKFQVELKEMLKPGDYLTLIPETHCEAGSLSVEGFRAFGQERGRAVLTLVYDELGHEQSCLTENFTSLFPEDEADDQARQLERTDRRLQTTIPIDLSHLPPNARIELRVTTDNAPSTSYQNSPQPVVVYLNYQ